VTPLVYFDELYVYAKTLHQQKYRYLQDAFDQMAATKNINNPAHFSNDRIIPVTELPNSDDIQRIVIFDDFICDRNQNPIVDYFIQGRHKNCSVIYLTQSYFKTPKDIRLNCTHLCIFKINSKAEINNILRDHNVPKAAYDVATFEPFGFLYIDHQRNKLLKKGFKELSD
jgi:hypothetical protein